MRVAIDRHLAGCSVALAIVALVAPRGALAQAIPGENVNMVSGTKWPGGDPFLQRQNEPSLAVSSVNPQHVLAGANDYRTVDVPFRDDPSDEPTGDAWLGLFKSFDGGATWQSTLVPGYPQDRSTAPMQGVNSPLRVCTTDPSPNNTCTAAADPIVRSGTSGLFYYAGIAFRRGTNSGKVFVARLIDQNNQESGDARVGNDPIKYIDTRVVARGSATVFLDKPAMAVDIPRGLATCTIPAVGAQAARTIPAGVVYVAYARFVGPFGSEAQSDIMFQRSLDCGATWSTPVKVNGLESTLVQGAGIAIDPLTGWVYVTWRRFTTATEDDAILVARSFTQGRRFTAPLALASINPFDQDSAPGVFRSEGFPAIAISVDAAGAKSWAHVAWSQRPPGLPDAGDGRVVMTTSRVCLPPEPGDDDPITCDGTWSAPAPVDAAPLRDEFGNAFSRGHQFMPQLTFSQGRLMLLYYDSRTDHTRSYFQPNAPFAPDSAGRFYKEQKAPLVNLGPAPLATPLAVDSPDAIFTGLIEDSLNLNTRHTLDVRVAEASPGPAPAFESTQVSIYPFGSRGDEGPPYPMVLPAFGAPGALTVVDAKGTLQLLQQLKLNPPNLPMFKGGTVPFIGDYIDIRGQDFVQSATGAWTFNTAPSPSPVFHAVWTSNQDVRPPRDGDWTNYTPVRLHDGGASVFQSGAGGIGGQRPDCQPGQEGMRDQNIYTSRITEGLSVLSPQNVKPLSPTVTRGFVVAVENATPRDVAFQMAIAPLPAGTTASFTDTLPSPVVPLVQVAVAAHSTVSRSVFVQSISPAATITVNVAEVVPTAACLAAAMCQLRPGGLAGFATLNPPGSTPTLVDATGATVGAEVYSSIVLAPNITNPNITNPNITNPNITNPNITNPNITNPNITNPNITNPNITNPNITNPNITNPDITNPNITNPNITNPNITNPNITNPNITNPNITNSSISDITYVVKNNGNTTTSYKVTIVSGTSTAKLPPLQLIVTKTYFTPIAVNCELAEQPHSVVVAYVPDVTPAIVPPDATVDPLVTSPDAANATIVLRPGETAEITLRAAVPLDEAATIATEIAPAAVPHAQVPAPQVTYASPPSNVLFPTLTVAPSPASATSTALLYDPASDTFTALVTGQLGAPTPGGALTLVHNGTTVMAAKVLDASACAGQLCSVVLPNAISSGDTLVAHYGGDAFHGASASARFLQTRGDFWSPRAPMPTPRFVAAAAAANGKLYVIGGSPDNVTSTSVVEEYDPVTDTWTAKTPMPTRRSDLAAAAVNGKIYVFGGLDRAGGHVELATAEVYDAAADAWQTLPPMPTPRFALSAAAVGGVIYVTGGVSIVNNAALAVVEAFDVATRTWSTVAPLPAPPREYAPAAAAAGAVYVAGGTSPGGLNTPTLDVFESFSPTTGAWTRFAPLPNRCWACGADVLGGRIHVAGGVHNVPTELVTDHQVFDPATGTWSLAAPLPAGVEGNVSVALGGKLYVVGGANASAIVGSTVVYTPPFAAIPITACGTTLSAPGDYYLPASLSCPTGNAITITASDVRLDLAGFTLQGGFTPSTCIGFPVTTIGIMAQFAGANLVVRNGTIRNFVDGLILGGLGSTAANLEVTANCALGMGLEGTGNVITASSIHDNVSDGIDINSSNGGTITGSEISGNGRFGVISAVTLGPNTISGNTISGNGIVFHASGIATENVCRGGIQCHTTIVGNVVTGNWFAGIVVGDNANLIQGNTVVNNIGAGIVVGNHAEFNIIQQNTVTGNNADMDDQNASTPPGCTGTITSVVTLSDGTILDPINPVPTDIVGSNSWQNNFFVTDSIGGVGTPVVSDGGPGVGCIQ